jgi:ribosome-associated toxin RatA of RatAB toxin-antitoxin module
MNFCIALSLASLSSPSLAEEAAWVEVARTERVVVKTRPHAGSSVKEVEAAGIIAVPAWILKNVVDDIDSYPKLIPFTTDARVVDNEGKGRVTFQRLEMPFMQAREYVVTVDDASYAKADGRMVYRTRWRTAAKRFQHLVSARAVRVDLNNGSWTFEELPDGRSKATFRILVDPAGEMPTALVNIAQQVTVSRYLLNLEERAALPRYRSTRPRLASL